MSTPNIFIESQIDITAAIEALDDNDRIEWVKFICETVHDNGTVDRIRKIVNNTLLDD